MAKQISFAAEKIWRAIPAPDRQAILCSVWCSHCRGSTTIVDYALEIVATDLLLSRKCCACGSEVRRLIETA